MPKYSISYNFNSKTRNFYIYAKDMEEAKEQLIAIQNWSKLDGEVVCSIPIHSSAVPVVDKIMKNHSKFLTFIGKIILRFKSL